MLGMMQDFPLTTRMLFDSLEGRFGQKTVVTGPAEQRQETCFAEVGERTRKLIGVLDALGVPVSARVGTLMSNNQPHMELYLGVPSSWRVLHTINHRLAAADISYIINDAADDVLFVDRSLLPALGSILNEIPTVRHIIVNEEGGSPEEGGRSRELTDARFLDYEEELSRATAVRCLRTPDERSAAALCYTSGTTGRPKGVLYDHRSIVLHAMSHLFFDGFGLRESDVVMPIVPMFHANAWGLPYAVCLSGSRLVLPGHEGTPEVLAALFEDEQVSVSAAVATVWRTLLPSLADKELPHLRKLASGGGPLPVELSRGYVETISTPITGTWGMTEASPTLSVSKIPGSADLAQPDILEKLSAPGYPNPLVKVRLVQFDGTLAKHDGQQTGELQVTGPTVAAGYFGANSGTDSFTEDGWLRTGDLGTIDPDGCVHVVDRLKDLIKSGGEWIGSAELENAIMVHPAVHEAAVVARTDEKWGERPVAYVVLRSGASLTEEELRAHLLERVAKWWIPDSVAVVSEIPKTPTGKIAKKDLREFHLPADLLL